MTIIELREKRNKAWEAAKAFVETKRDKDGLLSAEDAASYAEMEQKIKDYGAEIERMEQMAAMDAQLSKPTSVPLTANPLNGNKLKSGRASDEYKTAMLNALRTNFRQVSDVLSEGVDANGGYLVTPHLISEIRDDDGNVIYSYETQVKRQIISEETSRIVSSVLEEGVATDGGAKNAYVAGYRVAAKTGTSEKKDTHDTDYTPYVCSTVAYAPADAPEIAAIIMVDEPTEGVLYGSVVAAPYIGQLLTEILPYYGVEAVFSEDELEKQAIETPWLIALDVERAQELAKQYGVNIEIIGDGDTVLGQSPQPLTPMEKGSAKVVLYTTEDAKNNKKTVIVPDLMGMTSVAANGTLTGHGLNIKISGTKNYMSGTGAVVYEQSIPAGTEVEIGTVVELKFRYLDPDD